MLEHLVPRILIFADHPVGVVTPNTYIFQVQYVFAKCYSPTTRTKDSFLFRILVKPSLYACHESQFSVPNRESTLFIWLELEVVPYFIMCHKTQHYNRIPLQLYQIHKIDKLHGFLNNMNSYQFRLLTFFDDYSFKIFFKPSF